ncbi:MAG: acetolactate synthase large subunit, partial [bacterium]|nr:acetolactate synthase large subunit [bacterium]
NITKKNYFIRSAHELLTVIPEACAIAKWGRPGPVLIDVPKNVQQEEIEFSRWPEPLSIRQFSFLDEEIDNIADLINRAERPVLYAGGGIISSGASALLARFARKNSIPVVLTLMGLGAFPANDPLYMGMPGMHGTVATNNMLNNADMIIAMGARFDDRAVCHAERFCPKASIIHVDIDQAEIDKIKKSFYSIVCDAGQVLEALEPRIEQNERSRWIEQVTRNKKGTVPCYSEEAGVHDPLHPHNLISRVSSMTGDDTIITTDVGQHQMWVAGAYRFQRPRTFLTSGGLGTMGFGLPAAIGAALANPHKQVICFSGDGSLLMNIQELATLADLQLNVKILVLNNGHLGLVRQQQELFYEGNYVASRFHTGQDFGRSARAFGIRGRSLVNPDDPLQSDDPLQELEQALRQEGPCLIDIPVNPAYNVLPMVPPGQGIDTMIGTEIFPGP